MSGRDSADYTLDSMTEITPHAVARRDLGAIVDALAEEVRETSEAIRESSGKRVFDATVIVVTTDQRLVETLRTIVDLEVFHTDSASAARLAAGAPFVRLVVIDAAFDGAADLATLPGAITVDAGADRDHMARTVLEALHGRA